MPVDTELLCGSISSLIDRPSDHSTADMVEVETAAGAYCEVQLATVTQWTQKQRTMILLEQFLASNSDGEYVLL